MLSLIKTALRITTTAFDSELQLLMADCIAELEAMGVTVEMTTGTNPEPANAQIKTTIIAYCKWKFGNNEDADRWESIYHEKLAQLKTMTGFTTWEA